MFFALLQTLRPKQWIKNLFVGVPLMFGQKLTDPTSLLITAGAIGLFCLVSGCTTPPMGARPTSAWKTLSTPTYR